ncbi:MAG: lysylphosphatidylglycerol synthase domain-containing protein [Kovacikia sp.]
MPPIGSRFKSLVRWLILGGTLFFLGKVLKDNWQQVASVQVSPAGWACLTIALGITLLGYVCAGWVWGRILQDFQQPIEIPWAIQTYLKTNIAKYLPGNVWQFYGRVVAADKQGATMAAATLSVLLEPLLMAASALLIALVCSQRVAVSYGLSGLFLQWASLAVVLLSVHPKFLNPLIIYLQKLKQKAIASEIHSPAFQMERYPLIPLLGEVGFLLLRGVGFLLTFLAVSPISPHQIPLLLSVFGLAWLIGFIIPGAPGGIGVFEATAIALMNHAFSPGILLSAVALYRLVSVLAEAMGAGLAGLDGRRVKEL